MVGLFPLSRAKDSNILWIHMPNLCASRIPKFAPQKLRRTNLYSSAGRIKLLRRKFCGANFG
jgi:hypothetical protein